MTLVVFADFQCPHCKLEAPVLRKAVQQYRGQAKLVFEHFPLSMHARAQAAAIAAEAAHEQGKFWEMHDLVFDHQEQLEDEDLERYAKQIRGLDVDKWKADYAVRGRQARGQQGSGDRRGLGPIQGTPAVFVNGRESDPLLWGGEPRGVDRRRAAAMTRASCPRGCSGTVGSGGFERSGAWSCISSRSG